MASGATWTINSECSANYFWSPITLKWTIGVDGGEACDTNN